MTFQKLLRKYSEQDWPFMKLRYDPRQWEEIQLFLNKSSSEIKCLLNASQILLFHRDCERTLQISLGKDVGDVGVCANNL